MNKTLLWLATTAAISTAPLQAQTAENNINEMSDYTRAYVMEICPASKNISIERNWENLMVCKNGIPQSNGTNTIPKAKEIARDLDHSIRSNTVWEKILDRNYMFYRDRQKLEARNNLGNAIHNANREVRIDKVNERLKYGQNLAAISEQNIKDVNELYQEIINSGILATNTDQMNNIPADNYTYSESENIPKSDFIELKYEEKNKIALGY